MFVAEQVVIIHVLDDSVSDYCLQYFPYYAGQTAWSVVLNLLFFPSTLPLFFPFYPTLDKTKLFVAEQVVIIHVLDDSVSDYCLQYFPYYAGQTAWSVVLNLLFFSFLCIAICG